MAKEQGVVMAKGRGNGMLGVGGQRRKVSRSAMRGQGGQAQHGPAANHDPQAYKRELQRKIREGLTAKRKT